ncbi:hypothetical protein MMC17_002706 [Xylographa soralifera]|nr:hypothetical protein [Xylographa soralifera]
MGTETTRLGPVLVFGGCGFIGYHIVKHLLLEPDCGAISVASRSPSANRLEEVNYFTCDITSKDSVSELLATVKPQIIIHASSSSASNPAITPAEHYSTIVLGTKNVLACATAAPSVEVMVYTSTAAVAKGYEHYNGDETAPLWESNSKAIPYMKAKAQADIAVREANTPLDAQGHGLLTATLRLPLVYGERDTQYITSQLNALKAGQTKVQLGNGKNQIQPVYAGNVAMAHVLAVKGLLESAGGPKSLRVDGEAFLIHDGEPQYFWDFCRMTWRHAGDTTTMKDVTIIPGGLALGLASMVEYAFAIFTLGQKRPPLAMNRLFIQYTVYNTTYSIEKARNRLGYNPVSDHDGNLKRSIAWEIEHDPQRWKGLKAV